MSGARLTVATAVDRGVPTYADLPANVVTDAKGRFKVTLPRGPSWRVRVLYFARALDGAPAGHDDARVRVATHATFAPRTRHLRGGQRAVFRGHVVGSYRPAGIRVELQGRRRGSYVTLSTAATSTDGTYRVSYRFTGGARGRYVFRLRVRHFPRFPYFRATSAGQRLRPLSRPHEPTPDRASAWIASGSRARSSLSPLQPADAVRKRDARHAMPSGGRRRWLEPAPADPHDASHNGGSSRRRSP